jgi:hypothetical protein
MKSGDFTVSRDDHYHRQQFANIIDPAFVPRTFFSHAALAAKQPVRGPSNVEGLFEVSRMTSRNSI